MTELNALYRIRQIIIDINADKDSFIYIILRLVQWKIDQHEE